MRSDQERLEDILQAIEQIERDTVAGKQTFKQDNLIQSAILYQFVIIGEAARAISVELRERISNVPWAAIVAMRNILVHRYYEVNLDITWLVVQDLPEMKGKIEAILKDLGEF